ncbi:gastrula zinc finger protein XlCGF28.1-like isoform X2 [Culicoides brevitarsis]|uniref:gastrula zinc finger protein XlCGF28.1-like isoform X2 n=1 Tax=Culicoides brevitarsis TaxID=469753 RepID=UPI00307BF516
MQSKIDSPYCQACGNEPVVAEHEIIFCDQCQTCLENFQSFRQMCDETQAILMQRYCTKNDTEVVEEFIVEAISPASSHEDEQIFACDICAKRFKTKKCLATHMNHIHLGKSHFICSELDCQRKFQSKIALDCHLREHEGKHPFECHICNLQLNRLDALKNHLLSHGTERAFKCSICEAAFTNEANRYQHMMSTHKLGRKYICAYCAFICHNATQFNEHVQRLHGSEVFQCDQCEKSFKHPRSLAEHKETHDLIERILPCPVCGKMFKKKRDVTMHVRIVHKKEKKHKCTDCDKSFTLLGQLKNHLAVHTGQKPYACTFNLCTQAFTQLHALKRHMTTHTGEKPFSCPFCEHKFAEKYYMKKHAYRCSMRPENVESLEGTD